MVRIFLLLLCLTGCASVELVNAQRTPRAGVVKVEWDGIGEDRAKKMARALMHSYCKPNGFIVTAINQSPELVGLTATPTRMGASTFVSYSGEYKYRPYVHFICREGKDDEQTGLEADL
jgi:hypothetical protein